MIATILTTAVIFSGCNQKPDDTITEPNEAGIMETQSDVLPVVTSPPGQDHLMMMQDKSLEDMEPVKSGQEADVTINMSNFKFSVEQIKAAPGETVTIKLTNSGGTHDFVIDELNIASKQIQTGEETVISVTVPPTAQPGSEFEYYCSVGDHRQQGMVGVITVE